MADGAFEIHYNTSLCIRFGSWKFRRLNQSRSKAEIPGWARREERLSLSKLKQPFSTDSDAELFMYLGPVHTNAFSFENAYFFIRFRLPSTLIRSKTEVYVCENGGFRKRSLEWKFLKTGGSASLCGRSKTEVQRLCVDRWKRRFSKTITSMALACPS